MGPVGGFWFRSSDMGQEEPGHPLLVASGLAPDRSIVESVGLPPVDSQSPAPHSELKEGGIEAQEASGNRRPPAYGGE